MQTLLSMIKPLTAFIVMISLAQGSEAKVLFNGETLDGWFLFDEQREAKHWSVTDGMIRGDTKTKGPEYIKGLSFLYSHDSYSDFEFRCMVRLSGDPKTGMINSGIQFRSEPHEKHGKAVGYQADIGLPAWWGSIYDEQRRKKVLVHSDIKALKTKLQPYGWNEYIIRAEGPRVRLYVNGIQAVDYIEPDPEITLEGRFALQLHRGGVFTVDYKDITVRELTPEEFGQLPKGVAAAPAE